MKQEEWRPLPSAPDYAVSDMGRVCRVVPDSCGRKPRVLKQAIGSAGRAQVSICVDKKPLSRSVHRLIAEAFLEASEKPMVCHKDGNPLNNVPSNLYYGDARVNGRDATRHGTIARGSRNGNSKLSEDQVAALRAVVGTHTEAARLFGIGVSTSARIRKGESWRHFQPPA